MIKLLFKNIKFQDFKIPEVKKLINKNGLFVFPSGPGLSTVDKEPTYLKALQNSEYVFFDSGYFVLLLRILKNIKVEKFSGYKFLKLLFEFLKKNNSKKILSIDPNKKFSKNNFNFFIKLGLKKNNIINYISPKYPKSKIFDKKLLKLIKNLRPDFILINLGGGVQEVLGFYLKKNLNKKNRIICTGAAISYFTGDQAPVNKFFDKLYLGWFLRIIFKPQIFFLRYFNAIKLFHVIRYAKISIKHR